MVFLPVHSNCKLSKQKLRQETQLLPQIFRAHQHTAMPSMTPDSEENRLAKNRLAKYRLGSSPADCRV